MSLIMNIQNLSIFDKLEFAIATEADERKRKLLKVLQDRLQIRFKNVNKDTLESLLILLENIKRIIHVNDEDYKEQKEYKSDD